MNSRTTLRPARPQHRTIRWQRGLPERSGLFRRCSLTGLSAPGEQRPRAGLTLFELLFVAAAMAVLAGVVLSSARSTGGETLVAAARLVAAEMRLARQRAILYDIAWNVEFDLQNHTVTTSPDDGNFEVPELRQAADGATDTIRELLIPGMGGSARADNGLRIGRVVRGAAGTPVTELTFNDSGGTGPVDAADTVVWLVKGHRGDLRGISVTVNWITGQARVGQVQQLNDSDTWTVADGSS